MQVTRSYSGTLTDVGSTSSRIVSFGATTKKAAYWIKNDFINQTIADFLREDCGVDAAYEARAGEANNFLWIDGVPFLFFAASNATYYALYEPYHTAELTGSSDSPTFFKDAASGIYSFSLVFAGNPETGFALRFKAYNASSVKTSTCFRFMRAKNILTGGDAVVWCWGNNTPYAGIEGNANGIDLDANGDMIKDSFSATAITYAFSIDWKASNKAVSGGKIALVPMLAGVWELPGLYCYIKNLGLTAGTTITTEMQTEIELSSRRFIQTASNAAGSGYINMGLIEVT